MTKQLTVIKDSQLLATISNKGNFIEKIPSSVGEAMEGISLSKLRHQGGNVSKAMLGVLVEKLNEAFNFPLNESQQITLIETIFVKYYYLKFEEVAMVFLKAITGAFEVYGKLTIAMIMRWLHEYDTGERAQHIESGYTNSRRDYFEEREAKEMIDVRHMRDKEIKRLTAKKEAEQKVNKNES